MIDASNMQAAALAWHDAGCSVVVVKDDGSKEPDGKWKHYQAERPQRVTVEAWFANNPPGIGIITGAVSGNLEMFEFEGRAVAEGVGRQLETLLRGDGHGDLWDRLNSGTVVESPSGGVHILYRVSGDPVGGNTKLAERPAFDSEITPDEAERIAEAHAAGRTLQPKRTLIETRGKGGYFVAAPSHGRVHSTGKPWRFLVGGPDSIPTISGEDRDRLHATARELDQLPAKETPTQSPSSSPGRHPRGLPVDPSAVGVSPIDYFNEHETWEGILESKGWTKGAVTEDGAQRWTRPGKTVGNSALTGGPRGDRFYIFSTSTNIEEQKGHDKFGTYAILNHGGDQAAAVTQVAAELRAAGVPIADSRREEIVSLPAAHSAMASVGSAPSPIRKWSLSDFLVPNSALDGLPEPEPLIADTLDRGTVAMLAGYKGTFKSMIAIDWALSLATGQRWQDRETRRSRVLYVAGEGVLGLRGRRNAWTKSRAQPLSDDHFVVLRRPVNLGKRDEIVQLESIIRTGGFEFIVIDTLNRCSVGLDENSAKDMGMVVEALYDLKRATPRDMGAIALIHHTGKDGKTVRGSSALEAGFDTVYTTSREGDDGPVTLRRTKRKDGPPDDAMVLTWHSVSETGSGVVVQPDRGTLVEWDNPAKSDRAVLAAIVGFAPGLGSTPTQVAADTGLNLRTVKRALTRLAGAGLAERCDGRGNWRATGLGEATSKIEK